jgi:ABC-2 type transport system permease protein
MFIKLILFEIQKTIRRPRSFIGFAAIIGMVALIMFGIWFNKTKYTGLLNSFSDSLYTQGNVINGFFVSYLLINTLWIHMPLLVALVSGDLLAGEANAGTWRLLLIRPVSRAQVLNAKFATALLYSSLLVALLAVCSQVVGRIVFGSGDLIVTNNPINIFDESDVLWRFMAAYAFGMLSMGMIASLAMMLSNFASNSIGPIIGTMVIMIVFTIITNLNSPFFEAIKPGLFTTYLNAWAEFFNYDMKPEKIIRSVVVLVAHILVFYSVTRYTFIRKDILS